MTPRKPANLLLVDDDPSLLKLLGMRLTSEGFNVTTAESGHEALRLLMREKIDIVISDLRMDEMDGMALFAEIQKYQPGMPVIILTAHGSIPDAVAATQQGVFSFLTKPVDRDALYKAIDAALELSIPAGDDTWREEIVTRSPVMLRLLEQAKMVAQSDVSVLINGKAAPVKRYWHRLSMPPAHGPKKPLLPSTVVPYQSSCWSLNYSAMLRVRLPVQSAAVKGCFRPLKGAHCSWMRSAICRSHYK